MKEEKTALITGGAKRLGRSISKELASSGYNVIIHYNSSENDALSLREELLEEELISSEVLKIKMFYMKVKNE